MRASALALVVAAALAGAPAAAAQTPAPLPEPTIAAGVEAGGVALGGLTVAQAGEALESQLATLSRRPVKVDTAFRHFQIGPKKVDFHLRAFETARRALLAGVATPPAAGRSL